MCWYQPGRPSWPEVCRNFLLALVGRFGRVCAHLERGVLACGCALPWGSSLVSPISVRTTFSKGFILLSVEACNGKILRQTVRRVNGYTLAPHVRAPGLSRAGSGTLLTVCFCHSCEFLRVSRDGPSTRLMFLAGLARVRFWRVKHTVDRLATLANVSFWSVARAELSTCCAVRVVAHDVCNDTVCYTQLRTCGTQIRLLVPVLRSSLTNS